MQYQRREKNPRIVTLDEIESFTLEDYGLTPAAVKAYMFGVDLIDPATGEPIGDDFFIHTIENAITQVEHTLDIAIFPRVEHEYHDYHSEEFNSYVYTHVFKRPIIQVEHFSLGMNGRPLYTYPREWWNVYNLSGHIEILPSPLMQASHHAGAISPTGQPFPMVHSTRPGTGMNFAPQMIEIEYVAGMLPRGKATHNKQWEMPATLEKLILKYATREILLMWGRLLVQPGLASTSISIDGISESMGTTQSARYSAMSAEIEHVNDDIKELERTLKGYFGTGMISI